jgi:hypothetical protein
MLGFQQSLLLVNLRINQILAGDIDERLPTMPGRIRHFLRVSFELVSHSPYSKIISSTVRPPGIIGRTCST